MLNLLNSVKFTKPTRNVFDLSHDVKLTGNMGELIPTLCMEAIPGDKFNISCDSLLRFSPLIAPMMHRVDVFMHYFFVPNRLLWDNWEDFITQNVTPSPALPTIEIIPGEYPNNELRLGDYLGIPPTLLGGSTERVSAIPFSAYQFIYNEYYRDQNLITEIPYKLADGDQANKTDFFPIRKRAWEHDYFTAALPFAQKGTAVGMPLGDIQLKAPWFPTDNPTGENPSFRSTVGANTTTYGDVGQTANPVSGGGEIRLNSTLGTYAYDPAGTLEVTATTVNDLRRAFRLQEWLEKAARGGSRYVENILSHFGVKSPDARLQRPEYITGTKAPVIISEVLNLGATSVNTAPQGAMAGHAVAVTNGKYGDYYCQEHGYIMGIMSVMPKTSYSQGIPKHFLKDDAFDYYWPSFANIGEQAIQQRELYAFPLSGTGDSIFGYIPRYTEYKVMPNRIAGLFRSSLDFWHLGRKFESEPALNEEFISATPSNRIFAVQDLEVDSLMCQILHKIRAVRSMPKFGNPSM